MTSKWMLAACGVVLAAVPMLAHHSFAAEYDSSALVTLSGTITKVEWTNPHAYVYLDVKAEDGTVVNWGIEGYPPNTLRRTGFTRNLMQEGTRVTITGWRARDNASRMAAREVTLPDGKKVFFGPNA
ncbi:MAG TPA: DUF6152 family protein [Bryobacteraceae bacterium]|jgi:hypothetical protein